MQTGCIDFSIQVYTYLVGDRYVMKITELCPPFSISKSKGCQLVQYNNFPNPVIYHRVCVYILALEGDVGDVN